MHQWFPANMATHRDRYEPCSRFWHFAVSSGGLVYIRGGSTADFNSGNSRQQLAKTIEQFDPTKEVWRQLKTKGVPHPGLSAVACVSFGGCLYTFGGFDGERLHCTLSQLELKTLTWSQLSAAGGPMRKDACGMAYFNSNKLAVIGGYGHLAGPIQPGSLFIPNERFSDGTGWTNEIHIFNISAGVCIHVLHMVLLVMCKYIARLLVLPHHKGKKTSTLC